MVVRYPLLVDALRLLPGVRPVCERYRLGEAKLRASRSPKLVAYFNLITNEAQPVSQWP